VMVELSDYVKKKLRSLDKALRKSIGAEIRKFQNGEPVNIKKLKGAEDRWRIAVGDWRILVKADKEEGLDTMTVTDVLQRKDAYR